MPTQRRLSIQLESWNWVLYFKLNMISDIKRGHMLTAFLFFLVVLLPRQSQHHQLRAGTDGDKFKTGRSVPFRQPGGWSGDRKAEAESVCAYHSISRTSSLLVL